MITQGEGAARLFQGQTARSLAEGFVTIQTAGVRELIKEFERKAAEAGKVANLKPAVRKAAGIIAEGYKQRVNDVTGGLKKSVSVRDKVYDAAVVAIVGPLQTGATGTTDEQASGNHAWMVEFGTGRRRPGTQNRRTYINVHQMINGRMRRHSSSNDQQFRNMSRGYYFLMGSANEPTRRAKEGSGYPHDFGYSNGRMHPITLHPGEDFGAMPAKHPMEKTIQASQQAVFNSLVSSIKNSIANL